MNYPATHILRVIDENVDGCGSDAVMYVEFTKALTPAVQEHFENLLRVTKEKITPEDCDTSEDMVEAAIEDFNGSDFAKHLDIEATLCDAPYFGVVTF